MSQALRKLSGAIAKSSCIVIFINQLREKVGVIYGNPETTTGGRALKFYASVRLDVRKSEQLKSGSEVIGNHVKCKVVKNKVAPPFKTAEFDIIYGKGISKESEIIELGINCGVIDKSGSWLSYNGEKLGQGKDKVRAILEEDEALAAELSEKILAYYNKNGTSADMTDSISAEELFDEE
jgi:recombination protein RecA